MYGLSVVGVAVFQHAPIVPGEPFSAREDQLHSAFATAAGFSFISFAVAAGFIETTTARRLLAFAVAVTATLLAVLIFSLEDYAGVWQRLLFIGAFAWLMYSLEERRKEHSEAWTAPRSELAPERAGSARGRDDGQVRGRSRRRDRRPSRSLRSG